MDNEKQHGGARPGAGRLQTRYNLSRAAAQRLSHIAVMHGLTRTEMLERLIEQRFVELARKQDDMEYREIFVQVEAGDFANAGDIWDRVMQATGGDKDAADKAYSARLEELEPTREDRVLAILGK